MPSKELPILPKGSALSAEHYGAVTKLANTLRGVTGDRRFIAADIRRGILTIRWIGPNIRSVSLLLWCKIKSIENNHLVVNLWDGETADAEDLLVAKPRMLQHNYQVYAHLSSLTPVDAQTVNVVTSDEVEGQWKIAPAYAVGDLIWAASGRDTGLTIESEPVMLQDVNEDARAWVEEPPEEDES